MTWMFRWSTVILVGCLAIAQCAAAPQNRVESDGVIGIVIEPGLGKIQRKGDQSWLPLSRGDFLFPGDSIRNLAVGLKIGFCPPGPDMRTELRKGIYTLGVTVKDKNYIIGATNPLPEGYVMTDTDQPCLLPDIDRVSGRLKPVCPATSSAQKVQYGTSLLGDISRLVDALRSAQYDDALKLHRKLVDKIPSFPGVPVRKSPPPSQFRPGQGRLYSVIAGISNYKLSEQSKGVRYARKDAVDIARFLETPRGMHLFGTSGKRIGPGLIDEKEATGKRIKQELQNALDAGLGDGDRVLIYLAGHGVVGNASDRPLGVFIGYDSDKNNVVNEDLGLDEIQSFAQEISCSGAHVIVFLDICRRTNSGDASRRWTEFRFTGDVFALLASDSSSTALESPLLGGGHGVFTYFLLRALNGTSETMQSEARKLMTAGPFGKTRPSPRNLIHYVQQMVGNTTLSRQKVLASEPYRSERLPSIFDEKETPLPTSEFNGTRVKLRREDLAAAGERGTAPLHAGELPDYADDEARAKHLLLRYSLGPEDPPSRDDFDRAARYFSHAQHAAEATDLPRLRARELFCRAKSILLNGRPGEAEHQESEGLLYEAIQRLPSDPLAYNALGISFLERAKFDEAAAAFRDAINRSPFWPYARHNLALALMQDGQFEESGKVIDAALRIAPNYGSLHYTKGLLLRKTNRNREAKSAFLTAIERLRQAGRDPSAGYLALATLAASKSEADGHLTEVEARKTKGTPLYAVQHNRAILDYGTDEDRIVRGLWSNAIAGVEPSMFELARRLQIRKNEAQGEPRRRVLVELKKLFLIMLERIPDHASIRIQFGHVLADLGETEAATREALQTVVAIGSQSSRLSEQISVILIERAELLARVGCEREELADLKLVKRFGATRQQRSRAQERLHGR